MIARALFSRRTVGNGPMSVVLIRSKLQLLPSVGGALEGRDDPVEWRRYPENNVLLAAFRSEIAAMQLNFFDRILSNEATD